MDKDKGDIETESRQRKFGLPGWMTNNIERLNFVTDFEQYACSPPESESFLTEFVDNYDVQMAQEKNSSLKSNREENCQITAAYKDADKKTAPIAVKQHKADVRPCYHSMLSHLKQEETFSSPDSTPCPTPEPSPIVRRKMSNPTDTVVSNPGRWFYVGKLNSVNKSIAEHSLSADLSFKKTDKSMTSSYCNRQSGSPKESKSHGMKLIISNFDVNAVGPTSW